MKNDLLKGFVLGALVAFPLYVLAEHIRYGFISTWWPLWALFVLPFLAGLFLPSGERILGLWRAVLFVEYALVFSLILLRVIKTDGILLAVLLFGAIYASYLLFARSA